MGRHSDRKHYAGLPVTGGRYGMSRRGGLVSSLLPIAGVAAIIAVLYSFFGRKQRLIGGCSSCSM
jgi:hypothetical protein